MVCKFSSQDSTFIQEWLFFGLFWGLGYYFFIMFGLFEQFGAFVCFYCFFLFLRQVYKCSYIVCFRYLLCDMVCVVHFSSVPYGQYLQVRLQSLPQSLLVGRVYGHRVSLFFFIFCANLFVLLVISGCIFFLVFPTIGGGV